MTDTPRLLDRRADETPKSYAAFLAYVALGARRSVREAARQHHSKALSAGEISYLTRSKTHHQNTPDCSVLRARRVCRTGATRPRTSGRGSGLGNWKRSRLHRSNACLLRASIP